LPIVGAVLAGENTPLKSAAIRETRNEPSRLKRWEGNDPLPPTTSLPYPSLCVALSQQLAFGPLAPLLAGAFESDGAEARGRFRRGA